MLLCIYHFSHQAAQQVQQDHSTSQDKTIRALTEVHKVLKFIGRSQRQRPDVTVSDRNNSIDVSGVINVQMFLCQSLHVCLVINLKGPRNVSV